MPSGSVESAAAGERALKGAGLAVVRQDAVRVAAADEERNSPGPNVTNLGLTDGATGALMQAGIDRHVAG